MSMEWMSIWGVPFAIHSAHSRATPGPSFTHTASHSHNPRTSGLSPTREPLSTVTESNPLKEVRSSHPRSSKAGTVSLARARGVAICSSGR